MSSSPLVLLPLFLVCCCGGRLFLMVYSMGKLGDWRSERHSTSNYKLQITGFDTKSARSGHRSIVLIMDTSRVSRGAPPNHTVARDSPF